MDLTEFNLSVERGKAAGLDESAAFWSARMYCQANRYDEPEKISRGTTYNIHPFDYVEPSYSYYGVVCDRRCREGFF